MFATIPPQTQSIVTPSGRWLLLALCSCVLQLNPQIALATNYSVGSHVDFLDANPGDNICATQAGSCTLRAAVQESNAHPGSDSISLQANVTYLLTRSGIDDTAFNGDLDIIDSVSITSQGAGTIVDGNGDVLLDRVFQVAKCVGNATNPDGSCINGDLVMSATGITIRNGKAESLGGGVQNNGALTLTNCVVVNNRVTAQSSSGGGIYSEGTLTISNSTIIGNIAVETGGGLVNGGPATVITGSTISANVANRGGGILNGGFLFKLVNSTISGNFSNGNGGGIYTSSGSIDLFNSTITRNQANADNTGSAEGGGVWNGTGNPFELTNSIISLNENVLPTQPFPTFLLDDCRGIITSQGNSIISDVIGGQCTVNGNVVPGYANIGPLQDNGGPTQTHALLRPSGAIDAGNIGGCTNHLGAPLTTDQRGFPRPQGARCDIGAFEASDLIFADGFEF